ncbi:hypothetical protein Hdeb2414_s0085g00783021 [Helianthus debilis subsp. tardiflorus]
MRNFQVILHNVSLIFLLVCFGLQEKVECFFGHDSSPDSNYHQFTHEAAH